MEKEKKKLNLKVIIPIVVVIIFIITCNIKTNDNKAEEENTNLAINSEMIEEIKGYIADTKTDIGGTIFGRKNFSDYKEFISTEITNQEQPDKYTYIANVKYTYKNIYNDEKVERVKIKYTVRKDDTKEKGYTIYELVN